MLLTAIISAVSTALATVMLGLIGRMIAGMHKDMRRFMKEHLWLLGMADWTKVTVTEIMRQLNITNSAEPPEMK